MSWNDLWEYREPTQDPQIGARRHGPLCHRSFLLQPTDAALRIFTLCARLHGRQRAGWLSSARALKFLRNGCAGGDTDRMRKEGGAHAAASANSLPHLHVNSYSTPDGGRLLIPTTHSPCESRLLGASLCLCRASTPPALRRPWLTNALTQRVRVSRAHTLLA